MAEKPDEIPYGCGLLILLSPFILLLFIIVYMYGKQSATIEMQQEAIKQNHAEYITTEEGTPQWQWKKTTQN